MGVAVYSSRRPCQQPGYRLEVLDGELLLYHPGQTKMLYCSQTASLIWHLCDGRRTSREIVELLSQAFPEAAEAIPEDVQVTLGEFLRHGAIRFG
jgi:hypothetical protein